MGETEQLPQRVRAAIPVRVRGMSSRQKFFDENTETSYVGIASVITRLQSIVDLETELHVMNLKNNLGGTFRVTWVSVRGQEAWHPVGLEQIEAEGNIWEIRSSETSGGRPAQAWLQCRNCRTGELASLPEAEGEFIQDGFVISRPCDRCKATTPWGFTPAETENAPSREGFKNMRSTGRAPLTMKIKVMRQAFGMPLEDICETINVSRNGACFQSRSGYTVGEQLRVVLPYTEGDVAIPVPARVVRLNQAREGSLLDVAIHLEKERQ
jgi:hypothetical protein